jgi:GT2 family glycosyltransferase
MISAERESRPVYLITEQPDGWLPAVLPKIIEHTPRAGELYPGGNPAELQRARWTTRTGLDPEESHFTVIFPVYNEEKEIRSSFASVMFSDIPASVDAQFIWVVNNSHDRSHQFLTNEFKRLGNIDLVRVRSGVDGHMGTVALRARKGNATFLLLRTPTLGKANAINVGNEFALKAGHPIAINMDSECYPEPDALPIMFGEANNAFSGNDSVTLIDGHSLLERNYGPRNRKKVEDAHGSRYPDKFATVTGAMFAWNPSWLRSVGGIKESLFEDYGLGLDAYMHGTKIHHGQARIWANYPSRPIDEYRRHIRYVTGLLQLKSHWHNAKADGAIAHDFPLFRPLPHRLRWYWQGANRKPVYKIIPTFVTKILAYESARLIAYYRFTRMPDIKTWGKIR